MKHKLQSGSTILGLLIGFSLIMNSATAATITYPVGCEPVNYRFIQDEISLNSLGDALTPRIFLFHNISNQAIWLNHTVMHQASRKMMLLETRVVLQQGTKKLVPQTEQPGVRQIVWPWGSQTAQAGWASRLNTNHWTALNLASSQKEWPVSCSLMQPGQAKNLNCQDILQVCELQKVNAPARTMGSFWLGENLPLDALLNKIKVAGYDWQQ